MIYTTFFYSFWLGSGVCFIIDLYLPILRLNAPQITSTLVLNDYKQMVPLVATNLVLAYPYFFSLESYLRDQNFLNTFHPLINCLIWMIMVDFLFYTIHRAFHTKYLNKIHSIHHRFKYTYGMGAIYTHPIELYLANLLPMSLPMIVINIPLRQCDIIIFFATLYITIISHGGFRIKYASSHLYHHLRYRCNYGLLEMDRLMGTSY